MTEAGFTRRLAELPLPEYEALIDRLERYAERKFQESGQVGFPTVAQCAAALKLRVGEVAYLVEDCDRMTLTSFDWQGPLGQRCIEVYDPLPRKDI